MIEAGLGGRYDATNVIPSRVQVLTNVGLEHTRWLGPTVADIAREKLAVVRDGATLVVGEGCIPTPAMRPPRRPASTVRRSSSPLPRTRRALAARGAFQRRTSRSPRRRGRGASWAARPRRRRRRRARCTCPGRFEVVDRAR